MNQCMTYTHLNEFIQVVIQLNGMPFVVANYIDLRNQYYIDKRQT